MEIRKATINDWEEIQKIYADARQFMEEHGNATQWGKKHPPKELLLNDINQGKLYVCMNEKRIAAVFYFAAEDDPTYHVIEDGAWLNEAPYGVVHRIASARTVRGAASFCINWAFQQTGNIRIDTHQDNIPMQNMLQKNRFRYCGKIYLKNGDPRIAFQKIGGAHMQHRRRFHTAGVCIPRLHYMVDVSAAVEQIIREYIDNGEYFTINRARQFGKTTTLEQLSARLKQDYVVVSISFESADDCFVSLYTFAQGFSNKVAVALEESAISKEASDIWAEPIPRELPMDALNRKITRFCRACNREVILMIDEVDKSADNQIFLSFLGLLREKYLAQAAGRDKTFRSVILAGVYDVKNLKLKLHPGEVSKYNSPWNIAAEFTVDMGFSQNGITGMLSEYEKDYHTGMNVEENAELIYSYTKGYPYLVSYICKRVDENVAGSAEFPDRAAAWTRNGILSAVRQLVKGPNTLYDDMIKHVDEYPELHDMLNNILFAGQEYVFHEYDRPVSIGKMFGFIVNKDGNVAIANRIFEIQLYDYFLAEETRKNDLQREELPVKNQFVVYGQLDMDLVMKKFYEYFTGLYSDEDEKFIENYGRKIFLMYLRPIINGAGNFYVEDQSRTRLRSDIVVDYRGRQYVIECKIWRGEEYNKRGEIQLGEYLDAYGVQKGYLLSFNFNKMKETGIKELFCGDKTILEVVV